MKHLKKFFVCLMAMVVLCGSQLTYVNAAETEVMPMSSTISQDATKDGVTVTFYFHYSDGNSVEVIGAICRDSNYNMPDPPTSYFAGDTCYASVTVINKNTGVAITLRARCDIYGDSAAY